MKLQKIINSFVNTITSTRAAGLYLLVFALAIGVATFVENDFGTSAAQVLIFRSLWFELLLVLFSVTLLANIWRYRLVQQKKWASASLHLAIVIIIIGAGVTRYWGTEGMMPLREGQTSNQYLSAESFLKFQVTQNEKNYSFYEPVYFSSLTKNSFTNSYQLGKSLVEVNLEELLPNPIEKIQNNVDGEPMIKVVFGGMGGREEYFLKNGDKKTINGLFFNFTSEQIPGSFNISLVDGALQFICQEEVNQRVMATQEISDLAANTPHPLLQRALYTIGNSSFVIGDFQEKGVLQTEAGSIKLSNESLVGLKMSVTIDGKTQKGWIFGRKGEIGQAKEFVFDNQKIFISYGAKVETLPFSLLCKDFILEKYPGTENPSSYASEVRLLDSEKSIEKDFRIYMNHILEYRGYRFFQSSFDQDELGTYLSVNHDFWGTWISYFGYILLTIGAIMTFFDKNSRFSTLRNKLRGFSIVYLVLFGIEATAQETPKINENHAALFGKLIVQDYSGRVKPLDTYTREIIRKISKKESIFDQNSNQILLSMMLNPESWTKMPIIQVPVHPEIQRLLKTESKMLSYDAFFEEGGNYLLQEEVRKAQGLIPKNQGVYEKALLKLDEKVNIVNMVFSGSIFKIFPSTIPNSDTWLTPAEIMHEHQEMTNNVESRALFVEYMQALNEGTFQNNFEHADAALAKIASFQQYHGKSIMPSETQISSELLLNKLDVFNRLRNYYGLLGLVMTIAFLWLTIKKKASLIKITRLAFVSLLLGFVFHTLGLGLRWYVSERAPWSNGYESMIYIGWTTMLAGLLISRKSLGGLVATSVLAATILLVASMSWLDPEITPLVPVLKSYWLTIHVSLEAGSYGFLLLGAVVGMLNLVLMIFINPSNKSDIIRVIKELTIISEITLLAGLAMISVGTYLGGVWANESWGRYWGWDAKETWALVTILVYAFILHMRFIPKLQGIFAFNFASIFGFATVIMTYFGVNYYLSGLHSYAAGDPVPIPSEVYYTTITLVVVSMLAYRNYRKEMK